MATWEQYGLSGGQIISPTTSVDGFVNKVKSQGAGAAFDISSFLDKEETAAVTPPPVDFANSRQVNRTNGSSRISSTQISGATLQITPPTAVTGTVPFQFPAASARITYSVMYGDSSIPRADFTIPVGIQVPQVETLSKNPVTRLMQDAKAFVMQTELPPLEAPHNPDALKLIVPGSRVDFYVKPSGDQWSASLSEQWDVKDGDGPGVLLFSGFVDGTPTEVSGVANSLSITCVHWLAELNRGSFFASSLSPVTASDMGVIIGVGSTLQGGVAALTQSLQSAVTGAILGAGRGGGSVSDVQPLDVCSDALVKGAVGMCKNLSANFRLTQYRVSNLLSSANKTISAHQGAAYTFNPETDNLKIQAMLGDSVASAAWAKSYGSKWNYKLNDPDKIVPGRCVMSGSKNPAISGSIAKNIADTLTTNFGSSAPLDLIVNILAQYQLMIIPSVESFTVVPASFVRPARNTWRVIPKQGIINCAGTNMAGYSLPGSLIYTGTTVTTTTLSRGVASDVKLGVGAYKVDSLGPTVIRSLPMFLLQDSVLQTYFDTNKTPLTERAALSAVVTTSAQDIATGMAQSALLAERTAGHSMSVTLPFRTDISPGSQVALDGLTGVDGIGAERTYGFVSSVSIVIDAQAATAFTQLSLTNTRKGSDPAPDEAHALYPEILNGIPYFKIDPKTKSGVGLLLGWCGMPLTSLNSVTGATIAQVQDKNNLATELVNELLPETLAKMNEISARNGGGDLLTVLAKGSSSRDTQEYISWRSQ